MAKSIKKKLSLSLLLLLCHGAWAKLLDQTVGSVGTHVITLHDIRTQSTLDYLIQNKKIPTIDREDFSQEHLNKARQAIVTDLLIQDYMANIQLSDDVKEGEKEAAISKLYALEKGKLDQFLAKESISRADVSLTMDRKFRLDSFLEKQIAFRISMGQSEIAAHYEKYKQDRFFSKDFSEIENIVRADLKKEKLQLEFAQWIKSQIRRTEVTVLPIPAIDKP